MNIAFNADRLNAAIRALFPRKTSLIDRSSQGTCAFESPRDSIRFDVSGLDRGLYFLKIRFDFDYATAGPVLTVARPEFESTDHIFTFSSHDQHTFFGTVLIVDDIQELVWYPSRLPVQLKINECSVRRINSFSRDYLYGQAYVRWHVFGARWTLDRYKQEFLDGLARWFRGGTDGSYSSWWKLYGMPAKSELERQRKLYQLVDSEGLLKDGEIFTFSIILPVYKTDLKLLRSAVDSVLAQTNSNWELCICDDASNDNEIRDYLARLVGQDKRIKCLVHKENGHISAASNTAISLATGDYLAFLDHDDILAPDALHEIAITLGRNPKLKLLYSDEDVIDVQGRPLNPHFKPDWNYDLVRAVNYACHLLIIDRSLVEACGGLREGYEGAQDFDLLLRVTELIDRDEIHHVSKVLYHWRAVEGSTAHDVSSKPYASESGLRALSDHISRCNLSASVSEGDLPTTYRLKYTIADPAPSVSIVIPTHNSLRVLRNCVEALLSQTLYPSWEVLIVDNQSDDPDTLDYLREIEGNRVRVLRYPYPFNYSAVNNFAVSQSAADVLVLLNNDTEVIHSDWLDEMVAQATRPEAGAVGAKLFYANNYIQHAGVLLGMGYDRVAGHAFKGFHKDEIGSLARTRLAQEYSAVTAACLAVTRDKYLEVGGLDEKNLPIAFNDVDFCLRLLELGYRNIWTPYAQLYHYESYTRGYDITEEKRARFALERDYMHSRWGERLAIDPNYNPNLTRDYDNFGLAWPPEAMKQKMD